MQFTAHWRGRWGSISRSRLRLSPPRIAWQRPDPPLKGRENSHIRATTTGQGAGRICCEGATPFKGVALIPAAACEIHRFARGLDDLGRHRIGATEDVGDLLARDLLDVDAGLGG